MRTQLKTAIVVPFFNESSRWNREYWEKLQLSNLILFFVDDGSTDSTADLLSTISHANLIRLDKNRGKAEAVRIGFETALNSGLDIQVIGFLDADGAFETSEVLAMVEEAHTVFSKGFQAFWASRVKLSGRLITRSYYRHLIGRLVAVFLSTALQDFPYDSQCGFKLYKVDIKMLKSFSFTTKTRWFFELEHLSFYGELNGEQLRIWEAPLLKWTDVKGSKIYSLHTITLIKEILYVYSRLRFLNGKLNNFK